MDFEIIGAIIVGAPIFYIMSSERELTFVTLNSHKIYKLKELSASVLKEELDYGRGTCNSWICYLAGKSC